jgi:hypothetical protein
VRETFPELTAASIDIPTDHLQCTGALETAESKCPEGEAGIGMVTVQDVPNICVPGCEMIPGTDRRRPCPPTFTCVAEIEFSPRAPATCVPGLPGYRCKGEHSCLAGDCVDTGLDFDVCTMPCNSDAICEAIDGFRGPFWCVDMPSGKHCLNTESFRHECADETDCAEGEICSSKDAYHVGRDRTELEGPECRLPCDPEGERCARRGEMPFSCLPFGECHAGVFGISCSRSDECARGLSCESFDDEELLSRIGSSALCTVRCTTDSDCLRHPFVANDLATCLNPALPDSPAEDGVPPGVCIFPE